jgi:ribosomal-protein-alanine N-acetyltransferase
VSATPARYLIERMDMHDIADVQIIENQSFSSPWSAQAYEQDLRSNRMAHYVVLRQIVGDQPAAPPPVLPSMSKRPTIARRADELLQRLRARRRRAPATPRPPMLGFAGIWLMVDEAHLVTIAVAPGQRGKGLGELLLVAMIDLSCILGARVMTLEVRVSNHVAQSLYRKYGFTNEGVRRRYYSDNGEDALIMTTDTLTSASFQAHYQALKRALMAKLKVSLNLV